jgi:flagellar FliL protein
MSDTVEDVGVGFEEDSAEGEGGDSGKKKKSGGLGGLLPNLLKFIALGLGAVVLIVTVAVITYSIMNKGGKNQTVVPQSESYNATKPVYSFYTLLDEVTTRTRDVSPSTVVVKVNIGYTENDTATASELIARRYQLQDFLRNFFSKKMVEELRPENESRIKNEIRELLNTQVLDKARARIILFDKFEIVEM